ncbi:hypothetical protein LUZ60_002583 [Juncus effusus]|nr:hypothetical protein LUZ60_002583 [Juncus effusus]
MSSNFRERKSQSIASQLEGVLLVSKNLFPYFALVALEAGGPLRLLFFLLLYPVYQLLRLAHYENTALCLMIFISTSGISVKNIKEVSKATLPKFFLEDLREHTFRVFSGHDGKKYVLTCLPRVMVEPFLREFLGVNCVIGTELRVIGRKYSGLVDSGGIMKNKGHFEALSLARGDKLIDVGLADMSEDRSFLLLCKEHHLISPQEKTSPLARTDYPKPLIFHDGRLMCRPEPLNLLATILWFPLGVLLATTRILIGIVLPYRFILPCTALTGFRIRTQSPEIINNKPVLIAPTASPNNKGTLYVCNHQTLLDPVVLSTAILRRVSAVTYSLSSFSEVISPIPTIRLTRDRFKDRAIMRSMLDQGDLVVCPEGTTCREPYLLRFSPLFAEIAEKIVPVATRAKGSMFYGTTVRGFKWLDSPFFLMNPYPRYCLSFLEPVSGRPDSSSLCYDIANCIQERIGKVLEFECTSLTRKDKYGMLAGHDGTGMRTQDSS